MNAKTIKVDYLARVEGEGGLFVRVRNGVVSDCELRIFEPPRFFEAFLRGRDFREVPDITARICGICPVAYQMSSVHAIEDALGVRVEGPLRELRRLLYCGEWIESHALHIYMLHAPDFLGYEDAIRLAQDHPQVVQRGLELKKVGNDLVTLIGGREVHPINVRVGGFYKVPRKRDLVSIAERLKWALDAALETVRWTATLPFPDYEADYEFVSLRHPSEYPFNEGRVVSSKGIDVPVQAFERTFVEEHVERSTSLHSLIHQGQERRVYFVGPQARYALNFDRLTPTAQQAAQQAGLGPVSRNPFQSIIVRGVETVYAIEEALRIIGSYEMPDQPAIPMEPRAGVGCGCSEAPRGSLFHRYRIADDGSILEANIVPPTAQNQRVMEEDLRHFVTPRIEMPLEQLTWQCEQMVRNYDPCISCSCHYLKLHVEHEPEPAHGY